MSPIPAKLGVFHIATIGAYHPAEVVDLSSTGAVVAVGLSLKPKWTCELRFGSNGSETVMKGTVMRSWIKGFLPADKGGRTILYHAQLLFDRHFTQSPK